MYLRKLGLACLLFSTMTACAGNPTGAKASRCETGLQQAEKALDAAKAKNVRGSVEISKAAALIGAARVQYEFGKYPNCIEKVNRAQAYLRKIR
jgi:hypothetical protein